jgi:hypothetical protein
MPLKGTGMACVKMGLTVIMVASSPKSQGEKDAPNCVSYRQLHRIRLYAVVMGLYFPGPD